MRRVRTAIIGAIESGLGKSWSRHDLHLFALGCYCSRCLSLFNRCCFPVLVHSAWVLRLAQIPTVPAVLIQLFALIVASVLLLLRYTSSRQRLRNLIYVIIAAGLVSAFFGIVRKGFQPAGFFLPD